MESDIQEEILALYHAGAFLSPRQRQRGMFTHETASSDGATSLGQATPSNETTSSNETTASEGSLPSNWSFLLGFTPTSSSSSTNDSTASSDYTSSDETDRGMILDPRASTHGMFRTQRAWSWPLDRQQQRIIPDFPVLPRNTGQQYKLLTKKLAVLVGCMTGMMIYLSVGLWRYAATPEPEILDGWSKACPPNWLYLGSPMMILLGYETGYAGIRPPWTILNQAKNVQRRCWHGDKNHLHQSNRLNLTFPLGGTWAFGDINSKILERGEQAFEILTLDRTSLALAEDDLPSFGISCSPCHLSTAVWTLVKAALAPHLDATSNHPQNTEDLLYYCPCSVSLAWRSLYQTMKHLPQPYSIHPFYVDRKTSSLYQHYDLLSWIIWLHGNQYFVPWRRTNINNLRREEVLKLYADGFWTSKMGGKIRFDREEVREARGVKISRRELAAIEAACHGAEDCIEIRKALW